MHGKLSINSFVYSLLGIPTILRKSNLKIHMHGKIGTVLLTFYYHSLHHVQNHHYSSGLHNSSDACKYYPTKKGNESIQLKIWIRLYKTLLFHTFFLRTTEFNSKMNLNHFLPMFSIVLQEILQNKGRHKERFWYEMD